MLTKKEFEQIKSLLSAKKKYNLHAEYSSLEKGVIRLDTYTSSDCISYLTILSILKKFTEEEEK